MLIQKLIVKCCTLESPSSARRGSGHRPDFFFLGSYYFGECLNPNTEIDSRVLYTRVSI